MPKDSINIDEIMDKIHERRAEENRKGPKTIPKAVLRKYQAYLPKPPPPKLKEVAKPWNKYQWGKTWNGQQAYSTRRPAPQPSYGEKAQKWVKKGNMEWYPLKKQSGQEEENEGMVKSKCPEEGEEEQWPEEESQPEEQWKEYPQQDQEVLKG